MRETLRMKWRSFFSLLLLSLLAAASAQAAETADSGWETVVPGIEYREYHLSDPNDVYVARMDRSNPNLIIDSSIAQGKVNEGKETVRSMANRYNGAINAWGMTWGARNRVVVAINGSFYEPATGVPRSGVIHSGWYAKRWDDKGGTSGFAWTIDREAFIGECVYNPKDGQFVTFLRTGRKQPIHGVNVSRDRHQVILYTPQYGEDTGTSDAGVEVLIEMRRPAAVLAWPRIARGVVRQIRDRQGSTSIPFDHIVLSATGRGRKMLLENLVVGDEIGISQEVEHLTDKCRQPIVPSWTNTYASVSGSFDFLRDGKIRHFNDNLGATSRHPRTAICYNDSYIYFLVVDGRSQRSIGMTSDELARFCKKTLKTSWGINQDGGGSSTMWVKGEVLNTPSDGEERAVANGLMMILLEPMDKSTRFRKGDHVLTIAPADVYLGPGTNYGVLEEVPENVEGIVLDALSNITGVFAKGAYWWEVDFGETAGWVEEEALLRVEAQPYGFVSDGLFSEPLGEDALEPTSQLVPSPVPRLFYGPLGRGP